MPAPTIYNESAISGGEYAARLLGVDSPTHLVDHLIEHLSAKTGAGHESSLLEFKSTYHRSPEHPDDSEKLAKYFPEGFTSYMAIIATSRTMKGLGNRAQYITSFPLGDLTLTEALLLLTDHEGFLL